MRVVLHNVRSLFNVGSIFRTADALGIDRIYLTGITPAPVDRFGAVRSRLAKVALGAQHSVPWEKVSRLGPLLKKLKTEGFLIYALEQSPAALPYYRARLPKRFWPRAVLVLGNEIKGLPQAVLKAAARVLEIPMLGRKESLNVAVAFGVVAAHLRFSAK